MSENTEIAESPSEWQQWLIYVGPLAAYMFVSSFIVSIWERINIQLIAGDSPAVALTVAWARTFAIAAILIWGGKTLLRRFPFRIHFSSILFGCIGAILWISMCNLNLESKILTALGFSTELFGSRQAINPWDFYEESISRNLFLVPRLSLLVIGVPIAEELFLRGFLLRYLNNGDWSRVKLESLDWTAIPVTAAYGVLTHPSEWIAAAIWFSMVSVLMLRSRNLWDCIMAHSITNAILGIYIILYQDWRLW